jgi:hypothetical protein
MPGDLARAQIRETDIGALSEIYLKCKGPVVTTALSALDMSNHPSRRVGETRQTVSTNVIHNGDDAVEQSGCQCRNWCGVMHGRGAAILRKEHSISTPQADELAGTGRRKLENASRAGWRRQLAMITAVVFCISSTFPAVAAFITDTASWPVWWGRVDVVLAFVLAVLAFTLVGATRDLVDKQAEDSSYRAYRILTHGILAILLVFFMFGDRIIWTKCLTGFAWRAWLLLYCLPAWFTAVRAPQCASGGI